MSGLAAGAGTGNVGVSGGGGGGGREHAIPTDLLDDLCCRFIINVPEEERAHTNRLMFQVELAHWFYIDFHCADESNSLQPCGIKQFALHVFHHLPFLRHHLSDFEAVLSRWRDYKQAVPTCGAIVLDPEYQHVLLVQGYFSKSSWGFPKGKCNESELQELHRCAVREVQEEIGFDISDRLSLGDYLEQTVNEQRIRLYLVPGVPRDTQFQPKTRNEIKAIEWFPVMDLPTSQKDLSARSRLGFSPNSFFMVMPFVRPLKRWIHQRTLAGGRRQKQPRDRQRTGAAAGGQQDEARHKQQLTFSQPIRDELDLRGVGGGGGGGAGWRPVGPAPAAAAAAVTVSPQKPPTVVRAGRARLRQYNEEGRGHDGFSAPSWEWFQFDVKRIMAAIR